MKRGGFLRRKTPLHQKGSSETTDIKDRIQALVRRIVILRDKGCILRNSNDNPQVHLSSRSDIISLTQCNGYNKFHELILQADHLITRANSATYADTRLVVCVCKGHHGWKSLGGNARKKQYDEIVRTLLSPERVKLWDDCERDSWKPHRTTSTDWLLAEAALKQELAEITADDPARGRA